MLCSCRSHVVILTVKSNERQNIKNIREQKRTKEKYSRCCAFLMVAVLLLLQVRSSSVWTPRNRKSVILFTRVSSHPPMNRRWVSVLLLLLKSMTSSLVLVVFRARLLSEHHTDSCSTSSQYANSSPQRWAPPPWYHWRTWWWRCWGGCTALRGVDVQAEGWGDVGAYLHPFGVVRQEVLDPEADGVGYFQVWQFCHQSVGEDGFEHRGQVHKEQLCVAPLLLQVGQSNMESCVDGILRGPVGSVGELVRVKRGWQIWIDVCQDQFLKAIYNDWCQWYWTVVI